MHILNIYSLSAVQIEEIFTLADRLQEIAVPSVPGSAPAASQTPAASPLAGKTFVLFFPESSLRTRMTFERGIRDLGGSAILFPPAALDKREEAADIIGYMANWADGVIVRHPCHTKLQQLADASAELPVINAMSADAHPCEILADLYALRALRDNYSKLRYVFVGPVSNISRSWFEAAQVLALDFHHACVDSERLAADQPHYRFHTDLEPALTGSDVILTDALPDYLRYDDYISRYQITAERLKLTNKGVLLNPCPPFYRGEEVSACAIASEAFVGYTFKKSLLAVQQAVLLYSLVIKL